MFTIIWVITFFNLGNASLSVATMPFWGLVIAVLADFVFVGWGRRWYFRP